MPSYVKTFLITIAILVVFAYGFQVTEINLQEPKQPERQSQLTNVVRALARPDLIEYDTERLVAETAILIPCPSSAAQLPDLSQPGPTIQLSADCAEPGSELTISGSGFASGDRVFLYFVPYTENQDDEVELPLTREVVYPDRSGAFSHPVELRSGRTSENPQTVRATASRNIGWPRPTSTVYDTIEKIIETIFLALIATTLGTLLSIPISFLAARNLMIQVTSLFGSLVTLVAVAPLGWWLGAWLFGLVGGWGASLGSGGALPPAAGLWTALVIGLSVQAVSQSGGGFDSGGNKLRDYGIGLLAALGIALVWGLLGGLSQQIGLSLESRLGAFGFLGNFLFVAGDAMVTFLPLIGGISGLFTIVSAGGLLSATFLRRTEDPMIRKVFTLVMAILAGAVLLSLPAALVVWLYQPTNPWMTIALPGLVGGPVLGAIGWFTNPDRPVPTGLIVYTVTRTVLNALRAIEPLIMAIVFVVWVGIGPFAGVLALTLHTIAALGKLYSEQVENISQGPIEALTATGANRLQTIIYAVIPQIVPPYIAFTIYRWDINVRMSTIIGFAGGGGIGFLLQQNLNLLKYRQASVQMIAIAIVVASLDYVSAKIRERIT